MDYIHLNNERIFVICDKVMTHKHNFLITKHGLKKWVLSFIAAQKEMWNTTLELMRTKDKLKLSLKCGKRKTEHIKLKSKAKFTLYVKIIYMDDMEWQ